MCVYGALYTVCVCVYGVQRDLYRSTARALDILRSTETEQGNEQFRAHLGLLRSHRFSVQPLRLSSWNSMHNAPPRDSSRSPYSVAGQLRLGDEMGGPWRIPLKQVEEESAQREEEEGEVEKTPEVQREPWSLERSM